VLRVGLTGGIGAGKSTVAAELSALGAVVVDADRIAREVVEPGTDGLAEVVAAFGDDVLDEDGRLDRPALGRVVFADDEARTRLNGILHPRIGARTAELIAAAPDDAVVVHDVPLLVENGMGPAFALVVVVDAPEDVRVARLAETRDMPEEDARARIRAQATEEARRAAADVWIDNVGDVAAVHDEVRALWSGRIVPFEAGVRAGRAAPWPTELVDADPTWPEQAHRLAERIRVAGPDHVEGVEHVGPTAEPGRAAPDVIDLEVRTRKRRTGELAAALAGAGFPAVEEGVHGSADPARPAKVRLRRS
jgi:dephospho-CoA kinase